MGDHTHRVRVPGCFRCELGRDEASASMRAEIVDLEAEVARLRGERGFLRSEAARLRARVLELEEGILTHRHAMTAGTTDFWRDCANCEERDGELWALLDDREGHDV